MSSPPLRILVATRGRPIELDRMIRSISDAPPGSCLVVIENGSTKLSTETVEAAATPLESRYLRLPSGNKSAALNVALATANDDDLIVFFDDDVEVHARTLHAYVEAARRSGPNHYFGGPVAVEYEDRPPDWLLPHLPSSARGCSAEELRAAGPNGTFLGANWAAWARELKATDGFDPGLGPGGSTGATGQERDMQRKLRALGSRGVVVDDAIVRHQVPRSSCTPAWCLRRHHRNAIGEGLQGDAGNGASLFGAPLWQWSRLLHAARVWMTSRFKGRPERFEGSMAWTRERGRLRGLRLRRGRTR
ncbi:MAG: glycosyltransferase [Planctomycetota bacterium]